MNSVIWIEKMSSKLGWVILFCFLGLVSSLSFADEPIPPLFFALQSHSLQGDTTAHTQAMEFMQKAGVKIMRDEMYWSNVEREKGKIIIPENYKQNVDITLAHGMELLIILDYGNKFYDSGKSPNTPEGRAAFTNYCYTIVSTFRGKIKYFEIWNEPNITEFWKPQPNPTDYALLLQEAYKACKSANPDCVIVGGVTSGVDIDFLDKVFAAGGVQNMDILSLHPYRGDAPENGNSLITQLQKANELLKKYKKPMHIWMTEMGYPTHKGPNGHSEEEQADYLTRCYLETLSTGLVDSFFWYWLGPDGPDETYSEDRFGLVRQDESLKSSYYAYQTLTKNLTGAAYAGQLKFKDDNLRAYQFHPKENGKEIITAVWNIRETTPIAFETKSATVDLMDKKGNQTKYWTYENNFTLSVSESPYWLVSKENLIPTEKRMIQFDKTKLLTSPGGRRAIQVKLNKDVTKAITGKTSLLNKITFDSDPVELQTEPAQMFLLNPRSPLYGNGTIFYIMVSQIHPPESGSVTATLVIGGRPRGFVRANLKINPPVRAWIRPFLQDSTGKEGFNVYLQNLSEDTVSGEILVSSDADILLDQPTRSFENLITGDTSVIPIHIVDKGEAPEDTLFSIGVEILLPGMDAMSVQRSIDYLTCVKAKTKVMLDGKLNEWEHANFIEMGKPEQITVGKDNYRGPEDYDGAVYTMWDEKNFYIAAVVVDDTISSLIDPGPNLYFSDGLEVFFDTDANGNLSDHQYGANDFHYGFFDTPKGPVVWRWSPGNQLSPNAKICWFRRTDLGPEGKSLGYIMEGSIPFSELGITPKVGELIGFTIAADDSDTLEIVDLSSRDKQFTWAGDKFNYTDPSKFGFLFLKE